MEYYITYSRKFPDKYLNYKRIYTVSMAQIIRT